MKNLENSFCTQIVISIILVTIVSLFIGLSYKDTLVLIILTGLVVFSIKICQLYAIVSKNKKNQKKEISIPISNLPHITNLPHHDIQEENKNVENIKLEIKDKPYHLTNTPDHIIDADQYNLDDCTTDKSCIQNPDENNLFTGFENKKEYLETKKNNKILEESPSDYEVKKKDKIIVEKFTSNIEPDKLIHQVLPYNSAVINQFLNYSNKEEEIVPDEKQIGVSEIDKQVAYHAKIGKCSGGICKDIQELNASEIKEIIDEIKDMKKENATKIKSYHPFSKNFPLVRTTSETAHY